MLRVRTKAKCLQIIENQIAIYGNVLDVEDERLLSILVESQDAVIAMAKCMEKEMETDKNEFCCKSVVELMESICEDIYQFSKNFEIREIHVARISKALENLASLIEQIPACYQIVFFPYKADMWDSLESVWLACKEDPACECKVVPIPYRCYNANNGQWTSCYEIDHFPDYVPVIDYREYDLNECAEAAFIHNPYDEHNYVTVVDQEYFSENLKKYIQNLFYIPYYVTSGFIAEDHKELPAYKNVDYIVAQSESFKEGLTEAGYGEKALVLGSPKLDRVIRLCNDKCGVREEWKSILEGKKTLMLNTSINQILYDGKGYLQKLKFLFEKIKKYSNLGIIWRPHPLLYATLESLHPELQECYLELKEYFLKEKIGIFDATPDIVDTVAIADGYIGEASSSVVNLFEAAGKPVFILNNAILDSFSEDEIWNLYFWDCEKIGNRIYGVTIDNSYIFSVEEGDWKQIKVETESKYTTKWQPTFFRVQAYGEHVYLNSLKSEAFYRYNVVTKQMELLSEISDGGMLRYRFLVSYKNKLFYVSNKGKSILEYDTLEKTWKNYEAPLMELQSGITEEIYEDVFEFMVMDNILWLSTLYSNRFLCFCMDDGTYQILEVGSSSSHYGAFTIENSVLYVSHVSTGIIESWDLKEMCLINTYSMPEKFQVQKNIKNRIVAHSKLHVENGYVIAVPCWANMLVKIHLQSGEVSLIAEDFFADVMKPANNFIPQICGVYTMTKLLDETTLLIQRRKDAALLEVNIGTGEYKVHHPKLEECELEKVLGKEMGFEKIYKNGEFARRESRYFTFEGFLEDLLLDRLAVAMECQKKEMQTMAVNLDGTCGKKVHSFMMDVLKRQESK